MNKKKQPNERAEWSKFSLAQAMRGMEDEETSHSLEDVKRWNKTIAESQDKLDYMAGKALREHKAGKTKEMGFDEL